MKKREFTEIICKKHCSYYKEGKEELLCGTYRYLLKRYSAAELKIPKHLTPDFSEDSYILTEICKKCDFYTDGCDFREGNPAPPCGGYAVVEWLKRGNRGQPSH